MRLAALLLLVAPALAGDVVFTDVAVVAMDRDRVLERRNVLVREGRIAAIDDARPPEGALVIDGRGRFLMPGLADMHVHVWYEEELLLFLANGVTTVRNLWGKPMHLRWREEIERGERLGPVLFTSGDIVDGRPPIWQGSTGIATEEEARAVVRAQASGGFREVKVYSNVPAAAYEALLDEARRRGMRVTGHVPVAVGIDRVLGRQDCIEHLDGYFAGGDRSRLRELAARTGEAGTWNCPTLVVYEKIAGDPKELRARPEMRLVPPRLLATWDPDRDFRLKGFTAETRTWLRQWNAERRDLVRMLRDAGAPLLLGTDSGNPFVVAGFSAHEELGLLVASGLSPFEALAAGTRNAAEYMGDDAGTIEVGKRADLLLVAGNPLEDVAHARRPLGVMARGRWLPADELVRRLEEAALAYGAPKDRFRELPPLPEGEVRRFEVEWNGLVVGEECYAVVALADGSRALHVRFANDPPWSELRASVVRPGEGPTKGIRTDGTLSRWAEAWRHFAALEPGASVRLEHVRGGVQGTIEITRTADEDGARAFSCVLRDPDGERRFTVLFDAGGLPCGFREELQQGLVTYRRVR